MHVQDNIGPMFDYNNDETAIDNEELEQIQEELGWDDLREKCKPLYMVNALTIFYYLFYS